MPIVKGGIIFLKPIRNKIRIILRSSIKWCIHTTFSKGFLMLSASNLGAASLFYFWCCLLVAEAEKTMEFIFFLFFLIFHLLYFHYIVVTVTMPAHKMLNITALKEASILFCFWCLGILSSLAVVVMSV